MRFIVDLFQQVFVQWIVGGFTQTGDAQLVDIATDTTAQFCRGSLGKGDHQQFFNGQRAGKGGGTA
ncbi:Uncharacterised protein [Shigella sonnei]|nr:Uncharacterised protein [Shigella sonnei]CSP80683.1 Uncharacterised protein [Shigella sonnei]CSR33010.1 Uncharacterised protein [Shigella sonnei]